MTKLINAAQKGNLNRVKLLLNQGANVHARNVIGGQAIHHAALQGSLPPPPDEIHEFN
jgi:ankyrin repeat protein